MATNSLEEARDAVTRVYLPHELVGPSESMDMRLNATSDHHLTLGYLTYQALKVPDLPLLQGTFIIFSSSVILMNLVADVLYRILDPRVRAQ